jgi:predicted Zn-dependent protease
MDDDGLREAVGEAERSVGFSSEGFEQLKAPVIDDPPLQPTLWSEQTAGLSADERAELARKMIVGADAAQLQSAGELLVGAEGRATITTGGIFRYYPVTTVEVSANVRDPKHGASGWAGVTDYDLGRVDTAAIAARALEKAQRSANPVALEPGRFTVILEPQAVADLFTPLLRYGALDRITAESGKGPFAEPGGSKIGESVLDSRLVFRADPMDPQAGFVPFEIDSGEPFRPVSWIDKGVLRELSYQRQYAFAVLGLDKPLLNSNSYRLMPAEASRTTIDEMMQTTERGLLVTRFSDLQLVDFNSMLLTGFTRDGLWLIERGKISKAVKNFRFTESPLFALNNVEQIGTPVRVFDRNEAVVVPPIKVKDFSMTMLADAV